MYGVFLKDHNMPDFKCFVKEQRMSILSVDDCCERNQQVRFEVWRKRTQDVTVSHTAAKLRKKM